MDKKYKYTCVEPHATLIAMWLKGRGGIARWSSINLADPGREATTPVLDATGHPAPKPGWWAADEPFEIITDPAEVGVIRERELKRFHVGVRMGGNGMSLKVTDGGTRRIESETDKAREKFGMAWYVFDYGDEKNAVIMVADGDPVPITEWEKTQKGGEG